MFFNSEINTKEDLEKYSFLLKLRDNVLNKLNDVIFDFQEQEDKYFIFEQKYNNYIKDFYNILDNNNLNLREIYTKEEFDFIEDLINQEVIKNTKYINYLKYMLDDNSIFLVDTFRECLEKGRILKKEFILKLKNSKNKDSINNIINKIDEMEKSIFNKEDKIKRIINLQKQIINEIEMILNKLCFIFNVNYKTRNIKVKYLLIMDLLKNKNKSYKILKDILKDRSKVLEEVEDLNLPLDMNDIKKISGDGINFLLEKLRLYEMHKIDNRVKINFMVR